MACGLCMGTGPHGGLRSIALSIFQAAKLTVSVLPALTPFRSRWRVRTNVIILSATTLAFSAGISKAQEPVCRYALGSEFRTLDEGFVG